MSKKLLASLIALTMIGAYACGGDDDKEKESCQAGTVSCVDGQTNIKVCKSDGTWLDTTCAAFASDIANGVCKNNACVDPSNVNPPVTGDCTDGSFQCKDKELQQCANKAWSTVKTCGADETCDKDKKDCTKGSNPEQLDACAMTKDADCTKCQAVCASDGSKGYYCNTKTGKMVEKECANNVCSVDGNTLNCGNGGGETLEACAMEKDADCTKCQVVCASDGSKGYYCNTKTGKMVEKTCKDNVCSVDGNTLNCDNGGGGGETLEACAMEKDADCEKCQVVCAADGSKGYYCNTKTGKMVEKTCKDNICSVDKNTLNCDNGGGGGETLEACAMEKDADCEKCQVVCTTDGSKGYYCNTKTGKMVEKNCKDNVCSVDKNTLNCENAGSGDLTACAMEKDADCSLCQAVCSTDGSKGYYCNTKTSKMVEKSCNDNICSVDGNTLNCDDRDACTASSDKACIGACSDDKKTGYYWSQGLKTVDCSAKADCSVVNGNVACGEQDTCTADSYTPSCSSDNTYALYCSSKGLVKQYNCKEGTACVIHTDGKCTVDSDNCKSGKYDTTKYPKGYFECATK